MDSGAAAQPLARVNLAVSLGRRGQPGDAIPHILEAIRLQPESAQWRYFAGVMLLEAGRRAESIAMLQGALRVDPQHRGARDALRSLEGGFR